MGPSKEKSMKSQRTNLSFENFAIVLAALSTGSALGCAGQERQPVTASDVAPAAPAASPTAAAPAQPPAAQASLAPAAPPPVVAVPAPADPPATPSTATPAK